MARDRQPDFKLATVRGIEIRIDWSLVFVFFLIAFNLGVIFRCSIRTGH